MAVASPPKGGGVKGKASQSVSKDGSDKKEEGGSWWFLVAWALRLPVIWWLLNHAYTIRLFAIENYGLVIHEFDPWFNFRATQYLADNGWEKFFTWFDYQSWYPLGRPVGTTIYPGMQITSVFIHDLLKKMGPAYEMSLNDVCCYVPAWFGVSATAFVGLLTYEATKLVDAGIIAAGVMAIIPAHIMRSVGGGYDNESVAMTAMCATFYFWVRSLRRGRASWIFALAAALSYFYMVATWGGYIFVLNLVALHALVLAAYTRVASKPSESSAAASSTSSTGAYWSYTIFYAVGTALAVQVPVVGWTPLKSLEQLGAFAVFGLYQLLQVTEVVHRLKIVKGLSLYQIRVRAVVACAAVGVAVGFVLLQQGYFGPLSSRIRGLFVKHTRTGNPLVDSVAEHQATSADAYWRFLHATCYLAPLGLALSFIRTNSQQLFIFIYAITAYYFSAKMSRLMILMGPICSALTGITVGYILRMTINQVSHVLNEPQGKPNAKEQETENEESKPSAKPSPKKKHRRPKPTKGKDAKAKKKKRRLQNAQRGILDDLGLRSYIDFFSTESGRNVQLVSGVGLIFLLTIVGSAFFLYSYVIAERMSNPSIIQRHPKGDGTYLVVDDYRQAYWWLRDNTPEDSRVMAWWDYGYQIAGIANRTTIADGNTWNHEHIATLGRCLTAPVRDAHKIIRHLADYVLIWTGGGGDDLAKSPHMARIGNSVYPDICPDDPTCRKFGFMDGTRQPTPMMRESLLYNLHGHNQARSQDGSLIQVNSKMFKEVFTSQYRKVRIFKVMGVSQASKEWVADPSNRLCDVEGGWFCRGQYPPALNKLIAKRKDFAQLEDFNNQNKDSEAARKYQEQYHAQMSGLKMGGLASSTAKKARYDDVDDEYDDFDENEVDVDEYLNNPDADTDFDLTPIKNPVATYSDEWKDSQLTSLMYQLVANNNVETINEMLDSAPTMSRVRSTDGRGPLWWAYEFQRKEIIDTLIAHGAVTDEPDANGVLPKDA